MIRKVLLVCGILSSPLYIAMNIIGAMQFQGYSSISQTVSELAAALLRAQKSKVPLAAVKPNPLRFPDSMIDRTLEY